MKFFLFGFVLLLLTSCGPTVNFDFDTKANFSQYTSYSYYATIESGLNPLDNERVKKAVDSLLPFKNLTRSESADILINFYTQERVTAGNTIGIGVGGGGRNAGGGVSGGIPIGGNRIEQQFTLDFVDAKNDALIWQGVFEGSYPEKATPTKRQAHYLKVIQKLLQGYPPKQK